VETDHKVLQVLLGHKENQVILDHKVLKVFQGVRKVIQGLKERLE
jgi:hypothetical protein